MAGIFNALVSVGKDALDKYMKSSDPNVVKAVNPSEYAPVPVQVSDNVRIVFLEHFSYYFEFV